MSDVRLIDANAAKKALTGWDDNPTDEEIEHTIDRLPTIEAVPVVHAKWIFSPYEGEPWCECSNCYYTPSRKAYKEAHRICHSCGAKMDGGAENG